MQKTFNSSSSSPAQLALAARLRPLSWWVRALLMLGVPLLASVPLWVWWDPESLLAMGWAQGRACDGSLLTLIDGGISPAMRERLVWVSLLPVGIGLWALSQLWRLFGQYREGAVFSAPALQSLRGLGWSLMALFISQPVFGALQSVALSWDNPPGKRQLIVSFSSDDYLLLMFSLLLLALAKVMQEAARAAHENEEFI